MSETVKVGRNRPPQNGWASKEEVNELRAEVAELRETNQKMLEEIKGLRAELGGAKRRHLLGAVATSAAAFFGKFFHRGEDLGDIPEEKLGKRENRRGAHAKGKEEEKGGAPIVSDRRDEKSKISREKEDKRNKGKHPLAKKVAVFALAATIIGGAIAGISQCSSHDIKGSDAAVTMKAGNEDLENPAFGSTQASAEENDAAKAEADLQNKANEMGISVESMKRLADEHGMPYDKIGTDEAQHYLSDQLLAKNNIAEPFDASTPETAKESLSFYIFNDKDVCAEFYAALHENPEGEVDGLENPQDAIDCSEQFKNDPAAFNAARKYVIGALNEDGTKVTVREATDRKVITYHKIHEGDSDSGTLGVGENKEDSNGMNEKIVETNFANRGIVTWTKTGCAQNAAPATRVVREATATPKQVKQEVVQREERYQGKQSLQYSWERKGGEIEHRQNDSKDPKANDTQQNADKNFEANAKANDDAPTYGGQKNPDASAKSGNTDNNPDNGSEAVPDDKNGSIGGKQDAKPGQQDWGGGGGAADSGQDKTAVNPGDQGGLGKDTTGSNQTDSGNGSEETNRKSSSQHRSSRWEEGGSETIDENGNVTRKSHSSASDTGWVNDNNDDTHSGGNQVNDDVELQLRSSVPISQED